MNVTHKTDRLALTFGPLDKLKLVVLHEWIVRTCHLFFHSGNLRESVGSMCTILTETTCCTFTSDGNFKGQPLHMYILCDGLGAEAEYELTRPDPVGQTNLMGTSRAPVRLLNSFSIDLRKSMSTRAKKLSSRPARVIQSNARNLESLSFYSPLHSLGLCGATLKAPETCFSKEPCPMQ
jgi:hypothetical protein